jgi:hypothetical protein
MIALGCRALFWFARTSHPERVQFTLKCERFGNENYICLDQTSPRQTLAARANAQIGYTSHSQRIATESNLGEVWQDEKLLI